MAETKPIPNQKLRYERERRGWSQQDVADQVGTTPLNVGRWERGVNVPGPYFRQKLSEVFEKSLQELDLVPAKTDAEKVPEAPSSVPVIAPSQDAPISIWNVPYNRNLLFTGREDILSQLREALSGEESPVALTQPQAISGLGGIGKTQTAVEYAYRYRQSYDAVLWARADSPDLLRSDFLTIAALLNLPQRSEQDQSLVVKAVLRWFDSHEKWLLILDNADQLETVSEFIPSAGKGHVLLTTRAHSTGTIAQRLEIEKMNQDEGIVLLLRRMKRLKGHAELESIPESMRKQVQAIVEALDGLPLALDQAGAYIEETGCSLSDYLKFYHSRRKRLLRTRGQNATGHPEPVATTWSLAFEKVQAANPAAAELLRLCAFLHPDEIPESMMIEGASELGPLLQPMAEDEMELNEAIGELRKYSLIKRDPEKKILNMHRLVQVVIKDGMSEDEEKDWAERVVRMVSKAFPEVKFEVWSICQQYLPHVQICRTLIEDWKMQFVEAPSLLYNAANYLRDRGQYAEAELLFKQSLELRTAIPGPEHSDVSDNLHALGLTYWYQGKYDRTESYLLRALTIRERVSGYVHPKTADSYNDLAILYETQGSYEQAENFYKRGLAIWEQIPEASPPDMATTMCNLALFYSNHQRYAEAEQLHQQSLAIRQRVLGPEHPEVATSLHQMGLLSFRQGKYSETEQLWQQALALREQALGLNHPDVAFTLNNLGVLYDDQGRYKEAEEAHLRALMIREQALGPIHPDVAHSLGNLASLYRTQKRYNEAEVLQQRALSIREQVHGPNHADLGFSFNNLAWLCYDQGKYAEAELYFERALAVRKQCIGLEHTDTACTLSGMAMLFRDQGKYEQAESLFQQALAIQEKYLSPEHPDKAETLDGLAHLYRDQGKYEQAELLFQQTLVAREKSLGAEHPLVADTLEKYTILLQRLGRTREAEVLETRAEAIRAKQE